MHKEAVAKETYIVVRKSFCWWLEKLKDLEKRFKETVAKFEEKLNKTPKQSRVNIALI